MYRGVSTLTTDSMVTNQPTNNKQTKAKTNKFSTVNGTIAKDCKISRAYSLFATPELLHKQTFWELLKWNFAGGMPASVKIARVLFEI